MVAVENGRVARDELLKEDSNFDLVLLDVNMPEMVIFLNLLILMFFPGRIGVAFVDAIQRKPQRYSCHHDVS